MTLLHQLGHRLDGQVRDRPAGISEHRLRMGRLVSERFADAAVEAEGGWVPQGLVFIAADWHWALPKTQDQRAYRLRELVVRD